jgi:hypothetical protein
VLPFDLTPHDVAAAVLDKVLLGSAAIVFGYWLNRKMEVFRSRRAMEAEFLRERTKRLDELFGLMLEVEVSAQKFISRAVRYVDSLKDLRAEGKEPPSEMPQDMQEALMEFVTLSIKTRQRGAAFRPWIGDMLANLCVEYDTVVNESARAQAYPGGPRDLEKIEDLKWRTAGLQEHIVATIREGAPPPPKRNT